MKKSFNLFNEDDVQDQTQPEEVEEVVAPETDTEEVEVED